MMNIRRNKGFTLIELLIVVAVIAVLATIAYPAFLDATMKARRSDALDALTAIRLNQEKWRANNTSYAGNIASVWDGGFDGGATASLDGYYALSLKDADATDYTSTAKPTTKGGQDEDPCGDFIFEVDSGSTEKYTSKYTDHTSDGAKRCWKR